MGARFTTATVLFILILLVACEQALLPATSSSPITGIVKQPLLIRNGPLGNIQQQSSGNAYWFQVGASGNPASSGSFTGANITIRTVYDKANDDAHSYWIGGYTSNGAFVQVGYLTTVTTTGGPYCCAWFWEYFPAGQSACCSPRIGLENSAGPIGSWHSYSMISNQNQTWSFYMDNNLLGTTPDLGIGSNDSGSSNAPAGMAEVADAINANDVLGPAEFVNMNYRSTSLVWRPVPGGLGFITYGAPSLRILANPYGSAEIQATDNDYLAGSGLPQPGPNRSTVFWPPTVSSPYALAINFTDTANKQVTPDWVSLHDSGNPQSRIFYSRYTDQFIPQAQGEWILDGVFWHNENVAPIGTISLGQFGGISNDITLRVFPVVFHVIGYLYSYPIENARVSTILPDSVQLNATTNNNGDAILDQLPLGIYAIRITVPRGISSTINSQFSSSTTQLVRVVGLPELLTILFVPVVLGAIIIVYALRKEEARRRAWESMTPAPVTVPSAPPAPAEQPPD